MTPRSFIADSAADAVAQIRAELGPEAVVLNVRQLPVTGLTRLWQKSRIEVLAHCPEPAGSAPDALAALREELAEIRQRISTEPRPFGPEAASLESAPVAGAGPRTAARAGQWRIGPVLERMGLLPLHAQNVVDRLIGVHGEQPPEALAKELSLAASILSQSWRPPPAPSPALRPQVFIGAAGVGKTTALCKWLAQSVLLEQRQARVWRLDGATANAAESLSVYGEILGVPVERTWPGEGSDTAADLWLVDLPGVDWANAAAVAELGRRLAELPAPEVHLVLNAAYEMPLLAAQVRAFAALPVSDLVITHLDEEQRWGKIWNLVLGTNYSVRFLSAGQNIPGDFVAASPEKIFARQFPR